MKANKKAYEDIIDSLEVDDEIYEYFENFADYCIEKKIPPISFKMQCEYVLRLSNPDIKSAISDTILHSWNSIVYSVDAITGRGTRSRFTDTAEPAFTPKRI